MFHFDGAWSEGGWLEPAFVSCDGEGKITKISSEPLEGPVERVHGYAIPGFVNAHSHAFQYAMAGTVEYMPKGTTVDNFWSWRDAMYKLALQISPEAMGAIATMLYAEMLRVGYTHVVEFHYLHHDTDGKPYLNLDEMAERLVAAAQTAGINITIVPIFYQTGGFEEPASLWQRRFVSPTYEHYMKLWSETSSMMKQYSHANMGVGVHSLRAVRPLDVIRTFGEFDSSVPKHIHIAEQPKEVEDCLDFHGARPVHWLLDTVPLDSSYHLVHATHTTSEELRRLAQTGAHVVLCPSTEGNLGDGLFDLVTHRKSGGRWSIGTDSHVSLSPNEELRLLDYGQRLSQNQRNILCDQAGHDSGITAYHESLSGGYHATGQSHRAPYFSVGQPLDAVVYDAQAPLLTMTSAKNRLSTIIYSLDSSATLGTIVKSRWVAQRSRHTKQEFIRHEFTKAITKMGNR